MKSPAKYFTAASLIAMIGSTSMADDLDNALKDRDLQAIMSMLKKEAQAAPSAEVVSDEPVVASQPAASAGTPAPAELKKVETVEVKPVAEEEFTTEELEAIRARLAQELAAVNTAEPVAEEVATDKPVSRGTESKGGLLNRLFGGGEKKAEAKPAGKVAANRPDFERPDMGSSASMRQNRAALDNLLSSSRNDVIRQAMTGQEPSGSVTVVEEEADWRDAGPDAWKYNGEWDGGTMSGQGHMEFADGWEYKGAWLNGVMNGQGTLNHPDGTRYEGQWRNGQMHGLGKLTYPDGWAFIGQWIDGKIAGQGTLINPGE